MQSSGYVLAGGASSRMGRDKALLPYRGATLIEHVARAVHEAAGNVALIGDPAKYRGLGYRVYRDKVQDCGPLGGIYTALTMSRSDWNLVVACDMPGVSAELLRSLVRIAETSGQECVAAARPGGSAEPLCAVYHRRCLPAMTDAVREKRLKMQDLVAKLDLFTAAVEGRALANVNTPDEWAKFEGAPTR